MGSSPQCLFRRCLSCGRSLSQGYCPENYSVEFLCSACSLYSKDNVEAVAQEQLPRMLRFLWHIGLPIPHPAAFSRVRIIRSMQTVEENIKEFAVVNSKQKSAAQTCKPLSAAVRKHNLLLVQLDENVCKAREPVQFETLHEKGNWESYSAYREAAPVHGAPLEGFRGGGFHLGQCLCRKVDVHCLGNRGTAVTSNYRELPNSTSRCLSIANLFPHGSSGNHMLTIPRAPDDSKLANGLPIVDSILVLRGLPEAMTEVVLVHELVHACLWLTEGNKFILPEEEELVAHAVVSLYIAAELRVMELRRTKSSAGRKEFQNNVALQKRVQILMYRRQRLWNLSSATKIQEIASALQRGGWSAAVAKIIPRS